MYASYYVIEICSVKSGRYKNIIIIITSRVRIERRIISKDAQSIPHKCWPSDYRRRGMSTD